MNSQLFTRPFITMSLAQLFTVSSFGMFFLFPLFITGHGGGKSDIGLIMGTFSLAAVFCRPWISTLVDRIGRKKSFSLGCLLLITAPLTYNFFQGPLSGFYLPLLIVRVFHGIGLAFCFTAAFTFAADIIPAERLNEGIGIFGITGLTGLAVGPIIGEQILRHYNFPALFAAAAGISAVGLLLPLSLSEPYRPVSSEVTPSFFQVFIRKRTLAVAVLSLLFGFGLSTSGNFVAPFAQEEKLSLVSLYFIAYSLAAILTRIFGGRIADRVGEEKVIPPALVLTAAGLLTLTLPGGNTTLLLAGFLAGTGHGFLYPLLSALALRNEPENIRGKISGAFTGSIDAGVFLGSATLGYVGEWAGFRAIFFLGGLALFLGLAYFKFWLSRQDQEDTGDR
ncbi:MAG: MFS transporter [bacterium]|nr:MFS transporter [bacterium]